MDLIYESRPIEEIIPSERPHFILTAWGRQFGVEVAELYLSETTARLGRMPEYSEELLNGGRFRHKDDPSHIKISKVDILNQDNEAVVRQVDALLQDSIRVIDCAVRAASMIENKGEKAATFSSGLAHTNLVILDHSRVLSMIAPDAFYRAFFVPELRQALAESPFREVFFATNLKDGHGFVPLKMLLLLAEGFFFNGVYTELGRGPTVYRPGFGDGSVYCVFIHGRCRGRPIQRRGRRRRSTLWRQWLLRDQRLVGFHSHATRWSIS